MGVTLAIHDAVTLANWISTLEFATVDSLERVFKKYRAERHPVAKEAFKSSQMFMRNLGKARREQNSGTVYYDTWIGFNHYRYFFCFI